MAFPMHELTITDQPDPAASAAIDDALLAHIRAQAGELTKTPLQIVARDQNGQFAGGLDGATYFGWLYVENLAVAEHQRRQGIGSRLLRAAEAEAVRRGCTHAYLDTFSFQARPFYEKHGYTLAGTLEDFPAGHSRFFLQKRLGSQ